MVVERPFDNAAQMARTLAGDIAAKLREAVDARGRGSFVATGGTTPAPLYRELSRLEAPWRDITVTLSDERWVPTSDPASNEALVRRTLLTGAAHAAVLAPFKTSAESPSDAVTDVDLALRAMPRPFDVTLLGLGADGHIASLFPGASGYDVAMANTESDPLVHAIHAPQAFGAPHRMTLTLAALLASRLLVLMFSGAAKHDVYQAACAGVSGTPIHDLLVRARAPVWVCWSMEVAP